MSNQRGGTPVSKYSMVERSDGSSEVDDTKYSITDEGEVITIDLQEITENPLNADGDVEMEMSQNSTSRWLSRSTSVRLAIDDDNDGDYIPDGHGHDNHMGGFGRKSCVKKRPVLLGFAGTFVVLVLPLMISLIVLAVKYGKVNRELHDAKHEDATALLNPWAQFEVNSAAGVVATDVATCSEMGVDILRNGGNAADAAVASALCLGVLNPSSSGIGGGCFILHHDKANARSRFYDSRETAPSGASPTMFDDNPSLSVNGGLAVAIPGELKGLYTFHQNAGMLPWKEVVSPSATLAKHWTITAHMAGVINNDAKDYITSGHFPELTKLFTRSDGSIKQEGDIVEQPALAKTLEGIAESGADYLYTTKAADLAQDIRKAGGILTEEDIHNYAVKMHDPVQLQVLGHTLISASGSSSGGAVVAGIVNFMEGYEQPMASQGHLYDHRLVEAMKHAFAIRLSLGDPDFVNTTGPIQALLNKQYMGNLRSLTSDKGILDINAYGGTYNFDAAQRRLLPEDHGTTHLSVLDKHGDAVAITSTVNTDFGSKVISPSTGITLNNEMDDFSNSKNANYYGLHPSHYNYPQPGKRPLSSMSPTILLDKNGNTRLVGGASGGPRIITATVQVLLNYMCCGFGSVLSALTHPRVHTQLIPETVYVEDHRDLLSGLSIIASSKTVDALISRGHNVTLWGYSMGVSQYVAVDPDNGDMCGVSDPRKNGAPAGL